MTGPMKRGCGENENRAVNKEREHEGDSRIDGGEFDRLAFAFGRLLEHPRLHNRRVQVKIMRHHGRAKNANADVEHSLIHDDARAGDESKHDARKVRLGEDQLGGEAAADGHDQRDHKSFDITEAFGLEIKYREHVQRSNDAPPYQRKAKKKLQPDGGADYFRQVACGDSDFAENPERPHGRRRIVIATRLGEVAASGDAKLDAQMLKQDRHEIGDHDDGEQRITELRAAGEIRRPVAWVHVADRHEKTGAGESYQLPPKRRCCRDHDAAVDFRQRNMRCSSAPSALNIRCDRLVPLVHHFKNGR